jgi:hypothetical protein
MISPKDVIAEVCAARRISVTEMLGTTKPDYLVQARVEIATRLAMAGHNINRIAGELKKDRTTVMYYLGVRNNGGIKIRPSFKKHGVNDHHRLREAGVKYKIPYAGADMREYQWKERGREP